jgi:hypothetical protein
MWFKETMGDAIGPAEEVPAAQRLRVAALLDAQATSGLSVGTFCLKVSVSTANFS